MINFFVLSASEIYFKDETTSAIVIVALYPVFEERIADENQYSVSLVYYRKGNETWGTPVANDCHVLVGTPSTIKSAEKTIMIIPNPVQDKAELILPKLPAGNIYSMVVIDICGREVLKKEFSTSNYTLDCREMEKGLYVIIISNENGTFHESSKFMVSK